MIIKCVIFTLISLYLLNNLLAFDICPPPDNKHECACSIELNVTSYECNLSLPDLANYHFDICQFYNVSSSKVNWKNVTCKDFRIEGKASEYNEIDLIKNLNFNELELSAINKNLLYKIFDIKSTLVEKINIVFLDYLEMLDFKFENFPNTQIINFYFHSSDFTAVKTISSNIFSKLKNIEEIELGRSNIRFLEDKSLMFSSKKSVKLKLSNNKINIDELIKSGLWNHMGMDIDLHKNNIDKLPEGFFKKFCHGYEVDESYVRYSHNSYYSIDLGQNPINCEFDEIKWIFNYDYKDRISDYFPLKNVACANLENRLLLFMIKSDFNILSNGTSNNQRVIQPWQIISICSGVLIMVILIIVISYMAVIKCSSQNRGLGIFSKDINFNKKFKVLCELGSGGFAIVYKVMDNQTKIASAIKKIHLKGNI